MGAGVRPPFAALLAAAGLVLAGCASSSHPASVARGLPRDLVLEARPIGKGAQFRPPAAGPLPGRCLPQLGPRIGVHVEVFAANRVVLVPRGIGTRPPFGFSAGRIDRARCYGALVTIDPTGLVLVRPGPRLTLSALFRAWGQPLSPRRVASFSASTRNPVAVFVDGRRRPGSPGSVPLTAHDEIVVEVGPHVPPHAFYTFPPNT